MKIGNIDITNVKLGDNQISKVYIGEDLIWKNPDFVFLIDTRNTSVGSTLSNQFKLPLYATGGMNFTVDWGDGTSDTITTYNQAEATHTYTTEGEYIIVLKGIIKSFVFSNSGDKLKMLDIMNWGTFEINTTQTFYGCSNMVQSATDAPTITSTSLSDCFRNCTNFNGAIGNWDVSSVANMSLMFYLATSFNQPIGSWNTMNVTTMNSMFYIATSFNQNINSWNTSKVTDMSQMFRQATSFNQPIGSWDVSKVTTMNAMFRSAISFNQDIGSWNPERVANFVNMFLHQGAFNNGGSPSINNWNVSGATSMVQMFYNTPFNQPIGDWDVSNVTSMNGMFGYNSRFNQDISDWNVSQVIDFTGFMRGATSTTYDATKLDAIYNKWSLLTLNPNLLIDFGTIKYTSTGQTGKDILTNTPNNWTIIDGGLI